MAKMERRCAKGSGTPDESCQYGIRSVADGEEQGVHQGTRISKRHSSVGTFLFILKIQPGLV